MLITMVTYIMQNGSIIVGEQMRIILELNNALSKQMSNSLHIPAELWTTGPCSNLLLIVLSEFAVLLLGRMHIWTSASVRPGELTYLRYDIDRVTRGRLTWDGLVRGVKGVCRD